MLADLHVHTRFSCDSQAEMSRHAAAGLRKGLAAICLTDHVDDNIHDDGFQYYDPDAYFREYSAACADQPFELLSGIEFSEPHTYGRHLKELAEYPYDFVIGSIHWVDDRFPSRKILEEGFTRAYYTRYWQEVLKAVEHGGFDALGHLDFPKRYIGELYADEAMIRRIFQTMLAQNIVLEINTSSLRKGLATTMPAADLIQLYRSCGGQYVTLGSDAHRETDVGADLDLAAELARMNGLQPVIFRNRRMALLP